MSCIMKKNFPFYSILGAILVISQPVLVLGALLFFTVVIDSFRSVAGRVFTIAIVAAIPLLTGWLWAAKAPLPRTLFARLLPLVLPLVLLFLAYIFTALAGEPHLDLILFFLAAVVGSVWCCFCLAFLIRSERRCRSLEKMRGAAALLGLILVCTGFSAASYQFARRDIVLADAEASVGHGIDIWRYRPFSEDNRLELPASTPSLRITENYPRLDGAIAAFPFYAAVAQAVYEIDEKTALDFVQCSNTVDAYTRLVDGTVDIFFGVEPSQEQLGYAEAQGLTLTEIPIGREAFVFFTHRDNHVFSLTKEQIRAVYGGRVRNWQELGGQDEAILAFQRPEGSGSQTALLRIMEGERVVRPLRDEQVYGMGDIILGVAAYHNRKNALGYSFRWYATALFANPDIRLLAVDGILPTPENIQNGSYPFIVPIVAVTARPLSPESQSLIDWILGSEGQDLLARVGYVPLQ